MRQFDYREKWKNLLTPEIVSYLTQIHEFKGEQTLFIEAKADTLTQLVEIAKIQSTESSNKIEGIYTSDIRLRELVKDKTRPRTRNEQEIAGYRDVLIQFMKAMTISHQSLRLFYSFTEICINLKVTILEGNIKLQIMSLRKKILRE